MTPENARFLFDFLLPQLESEQRITRKIMLAVPGGMGDYRPAAMSMTALELARHIALCEIWFLDAVIRQQFLEIDAPREALGSVVGVADWYAATFAERVAVMRGLSGEHLAVRVDYLGLRNDPAVAYLNIAIRHSVHHRGQLAAYLRPMGGKVPAIYVESGDEPYSGEGGAVDGERPPAF